MVKALIVKMDLNISKGYSCCFWWFVILCCLRLQNEVAGDCSVNSASKLPINIETYQDSQLNRHGCYSFQDPFTYRQSAPLQGTFPEYRCNITVPEDCLENEINITSCFGYEFEFEVQDANDECSNGSQLCQTQIQIFAKTDNGTFIMNIESREDMEVLSNVTYFTLSYQTCMDEALLFSLPITSNVPLNIQCGPYALDEVPPLPPAECLPIETTIATTEEETTIIEYDATSIGSESGMANGNGDGKEDGGSSSLIFIILGVVAVCLIILIIIGVVFVVVRRNKSTKQNDHKVLFQPGQPDDSPSENGNVNITIGNEGESGISITNGVVGDAKTEHASNGKTEPVYAKSTKANTKEKADTKADDSKNASQNNINQQDTENSQPCPFSFDANPYASIDADDNACATTDELDQASGDDNKVKSSETGESFTKSVVVDPGQYESITDVQRKAESIIEKLDGHLETEVNDNRISQHGVDPSGEVIYMEYGFNS